MISCFGMELLIKVCGDRGQDSRFVWEQIEYTDCGLSLKWSIILRISWDVEWNVSSFENVKVGHLMCIQTVSVVIENIARGA